MANILPNGKQTFIDGNGKPYAGGSVYFYVPNTTTPKSTWQDAAQTILNTNPVVLDGDGRAIIFGSGAYRQQLYDVNNNLVWDQLTYSPVSSSDLSNNGVPGGAGLIGFDGTTLDQQFKSRVDRVVDSIAALRALIHTTYTRVHVTGYYAAGDGGGGFYWYDPSDTTSADNGGSIIVASDGGRWKLEQNKWATIRQFGAKLDWNGTTGTDDTAAINACLTAMKGGRVVWDEGDAYAAGILINDTTFNNTTVDFRGGLVVKPDGGNSNYGGGWVGILIKDAVGVTLNNPRVNGNRTNMTQREQIFCIGIAGAVNTTINNPVFTETRGDCIYIGQSNWQANSANPQNTRIGKILHTNSALDGRNTVSIISAIGVYIESCMARNSGGTVNGFIQPGGIDVEPDFGYQICSDIHIGPCDITTGGTAGLGVFGKSISGNDANLDWNCFDIRIEEARVSKLGTTGSALSAGPFTRCSDLTITNFILSYDGGVRGSGPVFDLCQRIDVQVKATNVNIGTIVGPTANVDGSKISAFASNFDTAIIRTTGITNSKVFAQRMGGTVAASTSFGVQLYNNGRSVTQQDVTYNVFVPYDGVLSRAFRNEPGNLVTIGAGCQVDGGDWTGYSTANDATIPTINVKGWNDQSSIPTTGTWFLGTFVRNTNPVQSGGKIMIGWTRLNTGNNNVLNTDWSQVFATIS